MQHVFTYESPIGPLVVAGDEHGVNGLWMMGQKYYGLTLEKNASRAPLPLFDTVREWLDAYFRGETPGRLPPLAPKGSEFRHMIWKILLDIPPGQVTTYGEIGRKAAAMMGRPSMSAQAVGGAVGHNPISIIIPCHRVVGADGSLTGYAGGVERKLYLLRLEKANLESLYLPKAGTAVVAHCE